MDVSVYWQGVWHPSLSPARRAFRSLAGILSSS
jgi:hypothetical protein